MFAKLITDTTIEIMDKMILSNPSNNSCVSHTEKVLYVDIQFFSLISEFMFEALSSKNELLMK